MAVLNTGKSSGFRLVTSSICPLELCFRANHKKPTQACQSKESIADLKHFLYYGNVEIRRLCMHHSKNIRLSLDIPAEQHKHLKMIATKKGLSMREYILEALAFKEAAEEEEDIEMDNATFRKGLKKIRKERYQLAKNLSKR